MQLTQQPPQPYQTHPLETSAAAAASSSSTLFICRNSDSDTQHRRKRAAVRAVFAAGTKLPAKCYNNKNSCLEACPNIKLQTIRADGQKEGYKGAGIKLPLAPGYIYRVVSFLRTYTQLESFFFESANKSQLSWPISR